MAAIEIIGCRTAGVLVRELSTRPEVCTPPGIVYVVTTIVIQNRILNGRIGKPERRTFRVSRLEYDRAFQDRSGVPGHMLYDHCSQLQAYVD